MKVELVVSCNFSFFSLRVGHEVRVMKEKLVANYDFYFPSRVGHQVTTWRKYTSILANVYEHLTKNKRVGHQDGIVGQVKARKMQVEDSRGQF